MKTKRVVNDVTYAVEENIISGKKQVSINDSVLDKISKRTFINRVDQRQYTLKGDGLTSIIITSAEDEIVLFSLKGFSKVLVYLPVLAFLLAFVGGAIGGAAGGFFAVLGIYTNSSVFKSDKSSGIKGFISVLVAFAAIIAAILVYALIVGGLVEAFPSIFN